MAIYTENGDIEDYTWKDVFIDPETNKWEPPTRWLSIFFELAGDEALKGCPHWITRLCWHIEAYLRWLKEPRGVQSTIEEYEPKYLLKYWRDVEGFDYDGAGDYFYSEEGYDEYETEEAALSYLKKNIRCEGGFKPKLDTIEEYCQEFSFEFYERKY